ncbi:TetR/AcrR family transcriptional regulator [Yinghuangia sp. YIM S09857]|uniref:TetR/AcrR family transcriptional regulator n=1 Tax=Yinghuangia sp. YIM S09857 TaxID=3436929 RepID=UPI003F529FA1
MDRAPKSPLPIAGEAPPERADAARNRRRILDAAARIVAERGSEALTMNAVAHAGGIGVGTVYRRFGDVSQLLNALLDERERRFQGDFLAGPPPLGPGAPAGERLRAFLHALVDRTVEQHGVLLSAEVADPCARYTSPPYRTMQTHVATLVAELRPDADAAALAEFVLAPVSPSMLHHLMADRGMTAARIKATVDEALGLYGLT